MRYLVWGAWVSAADPHWLTASQAWWRVSFRARNEYPPLVLVAAWLVALLCYWWPPLPQRPGEIAYYACYGPRRSRLMDLAWVAGSRWHVEECFQQAKNEAGLDHYQVRSWLAWHADITLSMLALAWRRGYQLA